MTQSSSLVRVLQLGSQHPSGLIGLPGQKPLLSWTVAADEEGLSQTAFEIQCASDLSFSENLETTGPVKSSSQLQQTAPGSDLQSREIRYYRVRIETVFGWTSWSPVYTYEAGLLSASDYLAHGIGDDSSHSAPVALVRKDFEVKSKPVKARLYATAQGLYEPTINGLKVADEYLNPGWTAYDLRLNVATFDVTDLIQIGSNVLGSALGDGWHRGKLGFMNLYDNYGDKSAVLMQLEMTFADGSTQTIATDETFSTSTGELRFADIYDGCTIDFSKAQVGWDKPGFNAVDWIPVKVREINKSVLQPRISEPVIKVQDFPMTLVEHSDRYQLDAHQNISGWVKLVVDGKKGDKVTIRHAEVLEADGRLHTKALRTAKATDVYILGSDGRHVLEPRMTFHGFQHADVTTSARVISGVAVAISSGTPKRSSFSSSDAQLNRLHENVVWSQRDNFVGLPTDCPQRDERLGWTGDAQAFAYAANTLVDAEAFWRSWLIDLELDQSENGDVGAVVPDLLKTQPTPADGEWVVAGRAGWADAATIVPFAAYESFGSLDVLKQQLNSMRRWVDALHNRRAGEKLLPTEFQFGDWCDPDAPGDRPWEAKVSSDFVANAFFAHSADLLAKSEELVGSKEGSKKYRSMSEELKANLWTSHGPDARKTTAGCAIALEFEICPESERAAVAAELAEMVRKDNGRITTGFLGTPLILFALSKNGFASEAYLMLMRREIRSWLYQVDKGATTIWERWDAIGENGEIHSGTMDTANEHQEDASMISFNHYAYGAVIDWVYRNVAGLSPLASAPGYQTTVVAPVPAEGFQSASAQISTAYGELGFKWEISSNGDLVANLKVPFGIEAKLALPTSEKSTIFLNGKELANGSSVAYGEHRIRVTSPRIVSYR